MFKGINFFDLYITAIPIIACCLVIETIHRLSKPIFYIMCLIVDTCRKVKNTNTKDKND